MQDTDRNDTICDRSAPTRALLACLMAGWLALAGTGWAQTEATVASEATAETEPQTAEDSQEESLDRGPDRSTCPGCGQGYGQGRGRGCCGKGRGRQARGQGQGRRGQGRGCPQGDCPRPEAQVIHFLIDNHESLERTVEEIPGGVLTRTVSEDPEIVDAVRTHVRQMVDLIHSEGRIRNWDPLFREIFDRRQAIEMEVSDIEGGVEVREVSDDAEVTELIRAHAVKVEEFVARGVEAYEEETPLPAGYAETSP